MIITRASQPRNCHRGAMLPFGAVALSSEDEHPRAIRNTDMSCQTTQTQVREERPDGAGCPDVNMMSVDSGVETGNDSNDSSIVQHEGQHVAAVAAADTALAVVNQVAGNSVTTVATTNNSQMDKQQEPGPSIIRIGFSPVWPVDLHFPTSSLCSVIENYNFNENSQASPTTCAPGRVWFSKLLQMNLPVCGANRSTMEILKDRSGYRAKIRQRRHIEWKYWENTYNERKMRMAAATNNTILVKRLLGIGVSPNNHDTHGRTPLHHAACRGYTEMVRLLLEHGADPNQRDCVGNTPLHLATVTSKISVVTLLLTAGTDVLLPDKLGYNPLQLAQTKLRMLQTCEVGEMGKVKEEMHNIVSMLLAYLQKQSNMQEQVETLSNFCSRLSLSSTSDQVQDDVKDLLANIDTLSITS